jgi:hypothetical protein
MPDRQQPASRIGPGATVARQVLAAGLALLRDLDTQTAGAELARLLPVTGSPPSRPRPLARPPADLPGRWALAGQDESADKRRDGGIGREGCAAPRSDSVSRCGASPSPGATIGWTARPASAKTLGPDTPLVGATDRPDRRAQLRSAGAALAAPNGGSARVHEILGRSHSVRPGSLACSVISPNRRLTASCCWVKAAECRLPCYAASLVLGAGRCRPACQALRTVRSGWQGAARVSDDYPSR